MAKLNIREAYDRKKLLYQKPCDILQLVILIKLMLLYVLHGYGQLASYFIKSFEKISDSYFIVAPEGMHRFYLKGHLEESSIMDDKRREIDIDENTKNLALLIKKLKKFKKNNTRIFSGATAARWYFSKIK